MFTFLPFCACPQLYTDPIPFSLVFVAYEHACCICQGGTLSSACGIQALGLLIRVGPLCVCTWLLVVDKRAARGLQMHMCGDTFAQAIRLLMRPRRRWPSALLLRTGARSIKMGDLDDMVDPGAVAPVRMVHCVYARV